MWYRELETSAQICLMVCVMVVLSVFYYTNTLDYAEKIKSQQVIKEKAIAAGLEECQLEARGATLWVKDCVDLMNTFRMSGNR